MAKPLVRQLAFDILAGLVSFCLLLGFVAVHRRNDLQLFCVVTSVLFFGAGLLRGANGHSSSLYRAVLIALGGVVPLFLLRQTGAFTEHGYPSLFIVFSVSLAAFGAEARYLLSKRRLWAACAVVLLCVAGVTVAAEAWIPGLMARWSSREVSLAPNDFSFVAPDGKLVSSKDLKGRIVVLAFWASWCTPCQQELPDLQNAYEGYKGNPSVAFYALGGPWGDDSVEKEVAFARRFNLKLPLAFDSQQIAKQRLGVSGFPALLILDDRGRIRMVHDGYDASEHLADHVTKEIGSLQKSQL